MKLITGLRGWLLMSLCALAACTSAPSSPAVQEVMSISTTRGLDRYGGRRLSGSEIIARFEGQRLRDVYGTYTWFFSPDGTYQWGGLGGDGGNWFFEGVWRVEDHLLCWTLDEWDMGCRPVFEAKGIVRIAEEDGALEPWGFY